MSSCKTHLQDVFLMQMDKSDKMRKQVVVYCASSSQVDKVYIDATDELGRLLAKNDIACINGAGEQGLMGALNNSLIRNGGYVIGVIPQFMVDSGWCHSGLNELIVTEDMHNRKAKMAEISDAAIALPGGMGTLEELAEILTWKQLGLYNNPVIILNTNNYYTSLLEFFDNMIEEKFMRAEYRQLYKLASSPEEVIDLLQHFPFSTPLPSKYLKKEL